MCLNQYKEQTKRLCKLRGWDGTVEQTWLLLSEEFGELASAIRQYNRVFKKINLKKEKGQDVASEMADVLSYIFQLSAQLDIDLDDAWSEQLTKMHTKKYAPTVNERVHARRRKPDEWVEPVCERAQSTPPGIRQT
jgi:NTP pyrophosphatase (non-canonical NTP hydrolase)